MNEDESEKIEEKAHIDKVSFKSKIRDLFLKLWESNLIRKFRTAAHDRPFEFIIVVANLMLVGGTLVMAYYTRQSVQDNRDLVESNLKLLDYTRQANERTEKLFVGQNKPIIGVTPLGISQEKGNQSKTWFSVVNYSGFNAYKIGIDVKYGESNDWISEWRKARDEKEKKGEKKEVVIGNFYPSRPKILIPELKPGETKHKDIEEEPITVTGSLNLEETVGGVGHKGYQVLVRVTWENDGGHVFDEIHQYNLLCTKDHEYTVPGSGRSFTFIPEGVISQKN